jgi:hypothetical protein
MIDAIEWWDSLTVAGRSEFPATKNESVILMYYLNPADYIEI